MDGGERVFLYHLNNLFKSTYSERTTHVRIVALPLQIHTAQPARNIVVFQTNASQSACNLIQRLVETAPCCFTDKIL